MTNTTPTHDDWEAAREKRNEAATRFVWTAIGTSPNAGPADLNNQFAQKWLAEVYRWDAEMDRITAILDPKGEAL